MNKTTKHLQKQEKKYTIKFKGGSKSKKQQSKVEFFNNLKLKLTIFIHMHSGCPVKYENKTDIFEPGAKELFSGYKGTLMVANAANLPGIKAYNNASIPYLMKNVPFNLIRKKTRSTINTIAYNDNISNIQLDIDNLQILLDNIDDSNMFNIFLDFINESANNSSNPTFTVAIKSLIVDKNSNKSIKQNIIVTAQTELTSKIDKIRNYLSERPFKKIKNIYKQYFHARVSNSESTPFGVSIVYESDSNLKKAVEYFILDNPEIRITSYDQFMNTLFEIPNLTLRRNNLAYNFMHYLLVSTSNNGFEELDTISQDFDNIREGNIMSSREIVNILQHLLKFADVNLINSSCMVFENYEFTEADKTEIQDIARTQWLSSSLSPE